MSQIFKRAPAKRDLAEHFEYLLKQAGLDTADRFLENAERSFELLADRRELGSKLAVQRSELAGIRKWRVKDFEDFLIFYQPKENGVSIVRVLHASRDWWTLLGIE